MEDAQETRTMVYYYSYANYIKETFKNYLCNKNVTITVILKKTAAVLDAVLDFSKRHYIMQKCPAV